MFALSRALLSAGSRIEINSAMIPITTSSSTSVNAKRMRRAAERFIDAARTDDKVHCVPPEGSILLVQQPHRVRRGRVLVAQVGDAKGVRAVGVQSARKSLGIVRRRVPVKEGNVGLAASTVPGRYA